jgi:ubiquinone/menaquinone biosynthesis C-methylase UbiE
VDDLLALTARAEASHFWFHGFRRIVGPALAAVAAGRRDLRLVDCGAGTGHNLTLLAPHGDVFAFDLAPTALTKARLSGRPLVRGDITAIPFRSASFDVATSFDVLQCVPNDTGAVREMARVIKPGGTVLLTLAAFEMLRGDHSEVWNEAHRYTPASARALVVQAGLEPVRVSFMFASVFPLMLAARLLQRATRPYRALNPSADIAVPPAAVNRLLMVLVSGEAALARRLPMPVGSSLLVVAKKSA